MTNTPAMTLEHLDPASLVVDANVRTDLRLDKTFVGSVKERGVLVPIVAIRAGDAVQVRHGHRRTMAAVEAGLDSVPVVVVTAAEHADADETAVMDRLIDQYAENSHRAGLSTGEQAVVMQQLSLLGLSAAQIARRTKTPKEAVAAGLAVADSEKALDAAQHYDLDLLQAATLAEFADDEEAVEELVDAASSGEFDHAAQQLRDAREARRAVAAAEEELRAAGVPVVERELGYGPHVRQFRLLDLASTRDGQLSMSVDEHASCPGHAAFVHYQHWGEAGAQAIYVCTDAGAYGHTLRSGQIARSRESLTEAEAEHAREERRRVIQNNKAWRSAETVRRAWLTEFARTRKTAPTQAAEFLHHMVIAGTDDLARAANGGHDLACSLLGLEPDNASPAWRWSEGRKRLLEAIAKASPARAHMITVAVVAAACEERTGVHTWRNPTERDRAYFRFLTEAKYVLSDVEKLVLTSDPDDDIEAGEFDADELDEDVDGEAAVPGVEDVEVPGERL